jgi:hypothetical protein
MSTSRPSFPYFVVNEDNHAIIRGEATIHDELRRHNRRYQKILYGGALIAALVIGVWYLLAHLQTLNARGQTVGGEIVSRTVEDESIYDDQPRRYYLEFLYLVDGETYTRLQNVDAGTYARYQPGNRATIVYLPDDPTVAEISGLGRVNPLPILCLLGIGVGLLGLFSLYQIAQVRRSKHSQILQGEIVSAEQKIDTQRKLYVQLKYVFTTPEGARMEQSHILSGEKWLKDAPPRGTPVFIQYENPREFRLM